MEMTINKEQKILIGLPAQPPPLELLKELAAKPLKDLASVVAGRL